MNRLVALALVPLAAAVATAQAGNPGVVANAAPGAYSVTVNYNDSNSVVFTGTQSNITSITNAIDDIAGCSVSGGTITCTTTGAAGLDELADLNDNTLDLSSYAATIRVNPGSSVPSGLEYLSYRISGSHAFAIVADPDDVEAIREELLTSWSASSYQRKQALYDGSGNFVNCDYDPVDCEDVVVVAPSPGPRTRVGRVLRWIADHL